MRTLETLVTSWARYIGRSTDRLAAALVVEEGLAGIGLSSAVFTPTVVAIVRFVICASSLSFLETCFTPLSNVPWFLLIIA